MENKEKEMTIPEIQGKIDELKSQKEALRKQREDNLNSLTPFLATHNIDKCEVDGGDVDIEDSKNIYRFTISEVNGEKVLRMKKTPIVNHRRGGWGGFCHPLDGMMFEFMRAKEEEFEKQEETFYEGNQCPPSAIVKDYYELLKNDILNKGEISLRIKKYMTEDRDIRNVLRTDIDTLSNQISRLQDKLSVLENEEMNKKRKEIKELFSKKNLSKLIADNMTLKKEEGYRFKKFSNGNQAYSGNNVNSVTFKKETPENIYLEFRFSDNEEALLRVNKGEFKIENLIDF